MIKNYECSGQMTIFDLIPDTPKCHTCQHALNRGAFRLCGMGMNGYKHIGERVECDGFRRIEDEDQSY